MSPAPPKICRHSSATSQHICDACSLAIEISRTGYSPLAKRQAVAPSLVYATAWRFANGEYPVREISMAKLHASQMCCEVADECLQIFGGAGYMREYKIEQAWRDLRLTGSAPAPTRSCST